VLVAAALAVGVLVGLIAGLTGVGGGVLMVPFLYVLYGRLGVGADDGTALAHATSLAVIVPTAVRGLVGYRGTRMVRWRAAVPLAATGALSSALTAQVATRLPGEALRVGFGVFLLTVATDLVLRRGAREDQDLPDESARHMVAAALLGIPVGALSAALGVGGGIPATMAMYYLLRMPFQAIAPTSLALITVTGLAGTLSYLFQGTGPLPFGWVVGHVDFGHGLPLAVGAVAAAPLGVRLNRGASVFTLRRIFGVLLLILGADLVVQNL
jgi:uncharacterized membrane protein YfcA